MSGELSIYPDAPAVTQRRMVLALLLSLLFHLVFLTLVHYTPTAPEARTLQMELLPPEPVQMAAQTQQAHKTAAKQYVAPSEAPAKQPPPETTKLSDRDSATETEKIKRGLPGSPQSAAQQNAAMLQETKPSSKASNPSRQKATVAPPPRAAAPRLSRQPSTSKSLRLNEDALENAIQQRPPAAMPAKSAEDRLQDYAATGTSNDQQQQSDPERAEKLSKYEPFRKASLGAMLSGNGGTPDYLPSIPDGEITLLNAKADRHAVFVRRVALQVFGAIRNSSWAELSFQGARSISEFSVVHATMSPKGKLISVELESSSGVKKFDAILSRAAEQGSWDQNPPVSAQGSDGNIHFVFESRTWARRMGDTGQEQRWLLLGTGLL